MTTKREPDEAFERFATAFRAVSDAVGNRLEARGDISCPVCTTGTLRYSYRKRGRGRGRGDIAFECTTDGCVKARGH